MRPKPIEQSQIDELINTALATFSTANREVVENFCWNATTNPVINSENLTRESSQYGWNIDTINTIRHVLTAVKKL